MIIQLFILCMCLGIFAKRFHFYDENIQESEVYYCSYHEETKVNAEGCPGGDCWSSQYTDWERYNILTKWNDYRHALAYGTPEKYTNMFYMHWHWYLEIQAVHLVQKCSLKRSFKTHFFVPKEPIIKERFRDIVYGRLFKHTRYFESVSNSFRIPHKAKAKDTVKILLKHIENRRLNFLFDWDEDDKYFRRAGFTFFGCAHLVSHNVTGISGIGENLSIDSVYHLSCVFGTHLHLSSVYGVTGRPPDIHSCALYSLIFLGMDLTSILHDGLCRHETNGGQTSLELKIPCPMESIPEIWAAYEPVNPQVKRIEKSFKDLSIQQLVYSPKKNVSIITPLIFEFEKLDEETAVEEIVPLILKTFVDEYDGKFCHILILIFILTVSCVFLTVSLIFKFYVDIYTVFANGK